MSTAIVCLPGAWWRWGRLAINQLARAPSSNRFVVTGRRELSPRLPSRGRTTGRNVLALPMTYAAATLFEGAGRVPLVLPDELENPGRSSYRGCLLSND
jgi:hypothetical protein